MTSRREPLKVDLAPTLALHAQIEEVLPDSQARIGELIREANRSIRARGITFGGEKEMPIALSALILSPRDVANLGSAACQLHGILEKTLDWITADRSRLERFYPDHLRLFPYLRKCKGASAWQLFSRYDAVVASDGRLKFIECNTGCPAGFMHAVDFTEETFRALKALGLPTIANIHSFGMMKPGALIDMLLDVEERSGVPKELVAILTDENELKLELDLIDRDLKQRGRRGRIIDARELALTNGDLSHRGERISLTFNKVRISTPHSPNHCWKEGFEERYHALLQAITKETVASINSLGALSIAEDKGLLAHLHSPEIHPIFSSEERDFIDAHIPWTARLAAGPVHRGGRPVDLVSMLEREKDSLVLKPANEGRGFEVHVGRETSDEEWRRLCQPCSQLPMVAQEFVEPLKIDVACLRNGSVRLEKMFLTVALGVLDGVYSGILSRISPSIVTNVGRQGFVQAVFIDS